MSASYITPNGGSEPYDGYSDYARAMKAKSQPPEGETQVKAALSAETQAWGEDGFTFGDVLDIKNPLQQIPVKSDIYRSVTGDEIAPAARILGGGLLGGLPGMVTSVVSTIVNEIAGEDVVQTALTSLFGGNNATETAAETTIISAASQQVASATAGTTPASTTAGATAGSSVPTPATPEMMNFFTMNNGAGTASNAVSDQRNSGGIRNSMFRPLPMDLALAQTQQKPALSQQTPTNLALINQAQQQPAQPSPIPVRLAAADNGLPSATAIDASVLTKASSHQEPGSIAALMSKNGMGNNGLTDTEQKAANRTALLAAARDLRAAFQGHKPFETDEKLRTLQAQTNPAYPPPREATR